MASTMAGARPRLGSSSSSSLGSLIRARPTASIWRSPPDMVPARWARRSASRGNTRIDALEQPRDALAVGERRGAQQQVVLDALLGEQPPALGRQRQALAHDGIGRLAGDVLAVELDLPGRHRHDAGDGVQRRGLAGAVGAQQRHDRALRHFERDVGHADQVAVAHLEMLDLEQRGHGPPRAAPCGGRDRPRSPPGSLVTSRGVPRAISRPWWNTTTRLRQRDDHLHDVLDDHDGDAAAMDAAHQLDRLAHLGRRQAGHRLVEQQRLGLGGERAGDLEPLAPGRAEASAPARRPAARVRPARSTSRALARASRALGWRSRAPIVALSSTDIDSKVSGTWKVRASPSRARASGGRRVTSAPAKVHACPRSTGRSPVRQLKKVDLPAPLGPIRPRMSPSSTDDRGVVDRLEGAERLGDVPAPQSAWPLAAADLAGFAAAGRRSNSDSSPLGRKRAMITMMAP